MVFPVVAILELSLSAKAVALGSWILAVESVCEREAAKTWVGGKEHKSGILNCVFNFSIIWLITQNKLRQQQTWLKILTLFKKFWPWNCVTSSGLDGNHLLSLKKQLGNLFMFCFLSICSKACCCIYDIFTYMEKKG